MYVVSFIRCAEARILQRKGKEMIRRQKCSALLSVVDAETAEICLMKVPRSISSPAVLTIVACLWKRVAYRAVVDR